MSDFVDGMEVIPPGEKIGILTDCHGMVEPLRAALKDMRRRGITRIYSLGDNIGSGVNPKEVMDLLDEYGVISVAGNAEDYITQGIESFSRYINTRTERGLERIKNIRWTKSKLTEEQIKKIRLFPRSIELILGGKKVALCHFVSDVRFNHGHFGERNYQDALRNNDEEYLREFYGVTNSEAEKRHIEEEIRKSDYKWRNPSVENPYTRALRDALNNPLFRGRKIVFFDAIFQGHAHFKLYDPRKAGLSPEIYSIRAVGMGGLDENKHKASYVILTATEDGFEVEEVSDVEYDREAMISSIQNSEGNNSNIRRFVDIEEESHEIKR